MSTPTRALKSSHLAVLLALPAAAAFFVPLQDQGAIRASAPTPVVIENFVDHRGSPAHLRFDVAARRLTIVGEARRAFVYDDQIDPTRPFWWTTIGDLADVPQLRFLMLDESRRRLDEGERAPTGLPDIYTMRGEFAAVPVQWGSQVNAYVNTNAGDLNHLDPAHYRRLTTSIGIAGYLIVGTGGTLDLVVVHDSIEGRIFSGEAEGDGTAARTAGFEIDLVLQAQLELVPVDSLDWLGTIDNDSAPIVRYRRRQL